MSIRLCQCLPPSSCQLKQSEDGQGRHVDTNEYVRWILSLLASEMYGGKGFSKLRQWDIDG